MEHTLEFVGGSLCWLLASKLCPDQKVLAVICSNSNIEVFQEAINWFSKVSTSGDVHTDEHPEDTCARFSIDQESHVWMEQTSYRWRSLTT